MKDRALHNKVSALWVLSVSSGASARQWSDPMQQEGGHQTKSTCGLMQYSRTQSAEMANLVLLRLLL